jgi:hypothetical protein
VDVRTDCAATKAERLSRELLERDPLASAAYATGAARAILVLGGAALLLGAWFAPQSTAAAVTLSLSALFLGAVGVRFAACLAAPGPAAEPPRADRTPPISLLCPLYRECAQVGPLLDALSQLQYPAAQLEILLVVEADDPATALAARREASRRDGVRVISVAPAGPRTKPKALAVALTEARGELIAVYDAEDAPARDQLQAAARAFAADPDLAVVQAPLGWYNAQENWLTRQFALEYAAQFHVLLPALARWGWALPLGGTSNVFRADALRACGGWDPYNVTEDADIGFRLARCGWTTRMIAPGTLEEAPVSLDAWLSQRSRWIKGHILTVRVHARRPLALLRGGGPGAVASLILFLGANAVSAAIHPLAALATIGLASGGAAWVGAPVWSTAAAGTALALGYAAALVSSVIGAKRAGTPLRGLDLLSLPGYWTLHAVATVRAVAELGRRRAVWAKTRHGLTSTPRRAPDAPAPKPGTSRGAADDDAYPDVPVRGGAGFRRLASFTPGGPAEGAAPDPVDVDRLDRGDGAGRAWRAPAQPVRDRDRT